MASKFSDVTTRQVTAQRNRLIAARNVDESEKRMYIKVYMCLKDSRLLSSCCYTQSINEYCDFC